MYLEIFFYTENPTRAINFDYSFTLRLKVNREFHAFPMAFRWNEAQPCLEFELNSLVLFFLEINIMPFASQAPYIYMYTYIYVYIYVYIHICMYTYMYTYIYVYIHICIHIYIHTYMYVYVYVYIYVYIHICIHTYR